MKSLKTAAILLVAIAPIYAQSTFGTVLGTVKEPTGAVVPNAKVEIVSQGKSTVKSTVTDQTGAYQFVNIDAGSYTVSVEAVGFQKVQFSPFELSARETMRLDADLKLATQQQTVNVESAADAVVQTDASNISG